MYICFLVWSYICPRSFPRVIHSLVWEFRQLLRRSCNYLPSHMLFCNVILPLSHEEMESVSLYPLPGQDHDYTNRIWQKWESASSDLLFSDSWKPVTIHDRSETTILWKAQITWQDEIRGEEKEKERGQGVMRCQTCEEAILGFQLPVTSGRQTSGKQCPAGSKEPTEPWEIPIYCYFKIPHRLGGGLLGSSG